MLWAGGCFSFLFCYYLNLLLTLEIEKMIKIEKNVPTPEESKQRKSYPFHQMDVGDSVLISHGDAMSARVSARYHGTRYGKKFTSKKEDDGVRIWRVE